MVLSGGIQRINHILLNIPDIIWGHAVTHYAIIEVNFVTACFFLICTFSATFKRKKVKQLVIPLAPESYFSFRSPALFITLFFLMCKCNITWPSLSLHSSFVPFYIPSSLPLLFHPDTECPLPLPGVLKPALDQRRCHSDTILCQKCHLPFPISLVQHLCM